MRGSICGVLALVVGLALPVYGQAQSTIVMGGIDNSYRPPTLPFTLESKRIVVATKADGSTVQHESIAVRAMDSEGREYNSETSDMRSSDQQRKTHVWVLDPVAHTFSDWWVPGRKAVVVPNPRPAIVSDPKDIPPSEALAQLPVCPETSNVMAVGSSASSLQPHIRKPATNDSETTVAVMLAGSNVQPQASKPTTEDAETPSEEPKEDWSHVYSEKLKEEDLGTKTIQGLEARGSRTTWKISTVHNSNDASLVRTSEIWTAILPGLNGMILSVVSIDPEHKQNFEVTKFTPGEPDVTLFEPPQNYEITDKEDAPVCRRATTATKHMMVHPPTSGPQPIPRSRR